MATLGLPSKGDGTEAHKTNKETIKTNKQKKKKKKNTIIEEGLKRWQAVLKSLNLYYSYFF